MDQRYDCVSSLLLLRVMIHSGKSIRLVRTPAHPESGLGHSTCLQSFRLVMWMTP